MSNIPLALRQALEAGDCVLFVGAGLGYHLFRNGVHAPDGRTLAGELAAHFKIDANVSMQRKQAQLSCSSLTHARTRDGSTTMFTARRRRYVSSEAVCGSATVSSRPHFLRWSRCSDHSPSFNPLPRKRAHPIAKREEIDAQPAALWLCASGEINPRRQGAPSTCREPRGTCLTAR